LDRSLDKAAQGERQVVFITGEAGVGKTALVDDFQCRAAASLLGLRIARGQSVEGFGGKEPYYPVLEALGGMCRLMPEEVVRALAAQAPTWLVQFPALVTPEHREMLQREILGVTRDRMLREISEALETITSHNPLLLVLEDLQWADASTVDLISVLARRRSRARLMVIGTYRPVDLVLCEHPLRALKQDLLVHHLCRRIALEPLRESDVGDYLAEESGGAALPAGLSGWLYRRSEGNPLFMVALLEDMIQRGFILREEEQWIFNLPGEEIDLDVPETLHQMIAAQIERLSFEEQRVLEAASLESLGHPRFAVTSRAAAVDMEPGVFEAMCETLSRRYHILRPAGSQELSDGSESACYEFVHTLYRNVCYQRIPPRLRATLYWRIGEEARVGQPRGSALIATKPRLRLGR
jgi:predicted ATPase